MINGILNKLIFDRSIFALFRSDDKIENSFSLFTKSRSDDKIKCQKKKNE